MPPLPINVGDKLRTTRSKPAKPHKASRLQLLAVFAVTAFVVVHGLWGSAAISHRLCAGKPGRGDCGRLEALDERARCILSRTPLIDGHVDFPVLLRGRYGNHVEAAAFREAFENGTLTGQIDLHRLRQGASGGAFWSVYAPCPKDGGDFSDENYAASVQYTLDQIDVMNRLQKLYPRDFSQAVDSKTALAAFNQGKLISPLGVEGLHQIGNKVANLRLFYDLGVRYATLTHNCHNKFADAAVLDSPTRKAEPKWHGVSPVGPYSICPHPRNVNDDILQLVKKHNSLVMVNIAPDFISCIDNGNEDGIPNPVPEEATIQQVARHILHIGNLVGFDHVGVGTDFDGIPTLPEGFTDASQYPDLVVELLKNGVSDLDAAKVVGGNLLRVWAKVDAVAAELQAAGEPAMEDDL
ncbi:hypothetical protein LLEC1_00133 [Akanthomyces lecanii]|uniref:Dipeptidase n=1 Tax=Cordyceps confragosa TaxID=2714763 RepID=A0A179I3J9_CORDF|nr:hypothetical protein LLEC1_00133 [Akanthomyces lecanii]